MTGDNESGDTERTTGADQTASLPERSDEANVPPPSKRRRQRKTSRVGKHQIDIAKVLLAPVKLLQGARSTTISAYEASIRAQVRKAIDGKDSASIRELIELAKKYDLVATPPPRLREHGVLEIPKTLGDADQEEIFKSPHITIARIVEILMRHYDIQE